MKVLFTTTEIYPFLKTGGLADVSASLVPELRRRKIDAKFLTIGHPSILNALESSTTYASIRTPFGKEVTILQGELGASKIPTFVIESETLYKREGTPYGDKQNRDWDDNLERFGTLSWVAAKMMEHSWKPDILHLNDWHTGLTAAYAKMLYGEKKPRCVFTIHNIAYPGIFSVYDFNKLGLPYDYFSVGGLEYYGQMSLLKSGIFYSDAITTVSPNYAKELCSSSTFGMGFEGILSSSKHKLYGILNGADYDEWSPTKDKYLTYKYYTNKLTNKKKQKANFLSATQHPFNKETFLIGSVGRLVPQKGVESIISVVEYLSDKEVNAMLVLVGTGSEEYEKKLKLLEAKYPRHLKYYPLYSEEMAHNVVAASDAFLIPSIFEPCGLTQIYALRYGALPIVTPVGGLKDTVTDEVGFVAGGTKSSDVLLAVEKTLKTYRKTPQKWKIMVHKAMLLRFTWKDTAKRYTNLYEKLLSPLT